MFTIVELLDTNEQTSVRFCDIHLEVLSSGDTNQQNKIENYIFTRGQFWPSGIVFACVCVCMSVCPCVRQSWACPCDNSSTVQARITKFGSEM